MKKDETRLGLIPGKLWREKLQPVFPGNWDISCAPTQSSVSQSVSQPYRSVAQSCLTLCDPMHCSTPGLPVHHQLLECTQTHVHQVSDAIQLSHSLSSPSPPAPNLSHYQGLFQSVNSSNEVAKVQEFQIQHQSFQ